MRPVHTLVGIGLRGPHIPALLAQRPRLGFVEVHSENFFASGGPMLSRLDDIAAAYPVSLHGVALSLGSACGVDMAHLARLAALADRIGPVRISDHAAFSRVAPDEGPAAAPVALHAGDLLPPARTPASAAILAANIQQVQDVLKRPILIENLSAYLAYEDDAIPEPAFLVEVCRRAGCGLLLDLNNLVVNGLNRARRTAWRAAPGTEPDREQALAKARAEALDFVWNLPAGLVGEIHLAGFRWPAGPDKLLVDDHSQRISPTVWDIYEHAVAHLGEVPTAVEWDVDLPPLAVLLDEARLAAHVLGRQRGEADEEGDGDEPDGGGP